MNASITGKGAGPLARLAGDEKTMRLLAFAFLFLITVPMLTKIFTSDFGTHIAIGREIVQTRGLPDKEFLNYPSLGRPSRDGEWGFQAALYLVYAAGGFHGVSLLCWAVVFGIYLLLHRAMTLRGANPLLAVVAIFAFSGFLRIRIQPRPEIFTYLFIALTIFLWSEYYFGKRRRLVWLFPPMVVAWANMHPTYLMAFILAGAFYADALVRAAWKRELSWSRLRTWAPIPLAVVALGLVVCGLNPYGYDALLMPLRLISRGAGGSGSGSSVLMSISELTPVRETGMYSYYKAAAALAAVSLLVGAVGRRISLLDLVFFGLAFKGAWDSARAVSMMGLFLSPGVSLHLTGFFERAGGWFAAGRERKGRLAAEKGGRNAERGGRKRRADRAAKTGPVAVPPPSRSRISSGLVAVLALPVAGLAVFGAVMLSFTYSQLQYGVGMTEHKFSFAAADFLRRNPIPGRMFNFFDIGGFLDWQLYPQALTFIDGRTYNPEVFQEHQLVTGAMAGWNEILRRRDVNYIVTKAIDSGGAILPLIPALANDPGWELVFADGLFAVFVRNVPENREYIARHRIPKERILSHIVQESAHYTYLGVSPVLAYLTMSRMYEMMGNRPAAIETLRKALGYGEVPALRDRLMRLELGAGVPGTAAPRGAR